MLRVNRSLQVQSMKFKKAAPLSEQVFLNIVCSQKLNETCGLVCAWRGGLVCSAGDEGDDSVSGWRSLVQPSWTKSRWVWPWLSVEPQRVVRWKGGRSEHCGCSR